MRTGGNRNCRGKTGRAEKTRRARRNHGARRDVPPLRGALRGTPSASSNHIPLHGKGMSPDGFHRSARLNKAIPSKDCGLFLPWPVLSCSGKTLSAFSSFPYFRLLPYFRIRRPIAGGCPGPAWAVFLHASCGIPVCRECSRSVFHPEMGSPGLACMRA